MTNATALRQAFHAANLLPTAAARAAERVRVLDAAHAAHIDTADWTRQVLAARLDTKARDDIPADKFAVAAKRKLPIENADHVKAAWDLLDDTDGLTEAEKTEARRRILDAAKRLGVSTADWKK